MKKIVFALVVLLFAAPAWADEVISITAAQVGDTNEVIISWDASGVEPALVRAFGLNIQLDNDANIPEVTGLSEDYYIYPGTIQINAAGEVTSYGSIAAEYDDLPSDTLEGPPDGNGVTLEAASLYAPVGPGSPNAPPTSGDLASIIVSKSCRLCISANVSRAGATGVVMEDPEQVVTVNYACIDVVIPPPGCPCPGDLVPPGAPDGYITTGDMSYLIQLLVAKGPPYIIAEGDPLFNECADLVPPGAPDGYITTGDMSYLIQMLVAAGPPYIIPCP
jgi:hypothetical protein